jgi:type IV pilus assembly protein PilB
VVVADPAAIEKAINKHYGEDTESVRRPAQETGSRHRYRQGGRGISSGRGVMDIENLANEAPIIKFVNLVLYQAVMDRASDIHFEPFEDEFKIRYRVDGALYEMTPPPKHLALPVTSRIKVMANLDIAERRLPQDGRISLTMAGRQIDMRVSTLPTQFGESVVLRVLDRSAVNMELESWACRISSRNTWPRRSSSPTAS